MSLVTIAVDDVPIIPAMTKISRVPQPSAQPSTRPAPKLSAMYEPPAQSRRRPPPRSSLMENSIPRWNSSRTSPSIASRWISSGSSSTTMPGVCGPKTIPATMKNGIVGRPRRRPSASEQPGEQERRSENGELVVHFSRPHARSFDARA